MRRGEQTLTSEGLGDGVVEAVEVAGRFRLAGKVDEFGRFDLHAEREFVRGDAGFELAGVGTFSGVLFVEPTQQVQLGALFSLRDSLATVEVDNGCVAVAEKACPGRQRAEIRYPIRWRRRWSRRGGRRGR